MSLANPNDLIIPNTVGVITSAAKEANRHLDKIKESTEYKEMKYKNMAEYIREIPGIQYILQNRINGIPLDKLVNPERISNDAARASKNQTQETKRQRAYEDWFRS